MVSLFSVKKSGIHRVLVPRMVLELSNDVDFSVSLQFESVSPFSLSLFIFLQFWKIYLLYCFSHVFSSLLQYLPSFGTPSFCTLALLSSVAPALLFILSHPIPSPSGDDRSQCPTPTPHIPQTKWLDWQSSHCSPATAPPMVFQPTVNSKNSTVKLKINLTLFNSSWIGQCPIWQVERPPASCRKERFL